MVIIFPRNDPNILPRLGTLISPKYVLTAGKPYDNKKGPPKMFEIRTLKLLLAVISNPETEDNENYLASKFHSHPTSDILIAELTESIPNKMIRPVKLFDGSEEVNAGTEGAFLGWGFTSVEEKKAYFMKLLAPVISKTECINIFHYLPFGQFCAGNGNSTEAPCIIDIGGPLMINDRQYGILIGYPNQSNGWDCESHPQSVQLYTTIVANRAWIKPFQGGGSEYLGFSGSTCPEVKILMTIFFVIMVIVTSY